jgi:hypothetical protein
MRLALALLLLIIAAPTAAQDEGVTLESWQLIPSGTGRYCCGQGTLLNANPFRLSTLRIDFRAFNAAGQEIATAHIIELNVPPSGRVAYETSPFSPDIPCASLARVERLATRVNRAR